MKILLFIDNLGAGGAQRQLVGLSVMLKSVGHDVKVCYYYEDDFYKSHLVENEILHDVIPGAANTKMRILRVRNYFMQEKPDWVIAYQETPSLVACFARFLGCKFKLLVSERNTTQKVDFATKLRFSLYRIADAIVPNSHSQEKYMLDRYPWMSSKLTTITNFVDLDKFQYVEHSRKDTSLIIVAASVTESKNVLGFIKAARALVDNGIRFRIEWYGLIGKETEYHRKCFSLIKELDICDYFHLLPKTKEIHKKYQLADYFCLPSFFEGTPNVIGEAMASGCPIICSNVCDNPYYVKEGKNGFLFDPRDTMQIVEAVMQAISLSDNDYYTYCKNSRQMAEAIMSQDVFLEKYLKVLK